MQLSVCFPFDSTKHHRFSPGTPVSPCRNTGSIRDDPYWTSRKNSLELIELSSINIVSLPRTHFFSHLQNMGEGAQRNFEQNMQDALSILPKLTTGLDVNVKFTGYVL